MALFLVPAPGIALFHEVSAKLSMAHEPKGGSDRKTRKDILE